MRFKKISHSEKVKFIKVGGRPRGVEVGGWFVYDPHLRNTYIKSHPRVASPQQSVRGLFITVVICIFDLWLLILIPIYLRRVYLL
jgi:hypothetical protein